MPAHPNYFNQLADQIRNTTNPARLDELLDQWVDIRDRATEWDADQWGFAPDDWEKRVLAKTEEQQ
jgi:hypothetical protein